MQRKPVCINLHDFPAPFHGLLEGAKLFDSSCSPEAKVWLIEGNAGFFLKSAPSGSLEKEAAMASFFYQKGLGPEVLRYVREDRDWLLTRRVPGEDCLDPGHLEDPKWLCDTTAVLLRQLHETDPTGCPVTDLNSTCYPGHPGLLTSRVLVHGDYCLPNVMFHNWQFSGFIDVGHGGIGDRHIDLYWGCWSILYNLKEERWCSRFLDAYGREMVSVEKLSVIDSLEFPR